MTKVKRAIYAAILLALPALFLVCSASNPTNPLLPQSTVGGQQIRTNLPSLVLSALRFDLAADGVDAVTITALAKDPSGNPLANYQINWSISTRGFTGPTGQVTSATTTTGSGGSGSTGYISPQLDFVQVGASVSVRGTLIVPGNPQGSPTASVTFILRPKGNAPAGGTDTSTGLPLAPVVIAVTPTSIKVDANPPVPVIVQGSNFADSSVVLLVTAEALVTTTTQFFSKEQLRFTVPSGLKAGTATLFVTAPGDQLSLGFPVILTTGVQTSSIPTSPAITLILPTQGPVGQSTRIVLLGTGFNVNTCPSFGNISMINEFIGLRKLCPVSGEPATSQRLVFDSPVFGSTQSGVASVFVQNDDGTTSNTVVFQVVPSNTNAPSITALSPSTGATTGQNKVLIAGANFDGTHQVVIAGPNVETVLSDVCTGDGLPLCANSQCILSEARGTCTINGTPGFDPFAFFGSGQIEIVMPNVGTSAGSPVDVLIRTPSGQPSNIVTYTYTSPAALQPPVIADIFPDLYAGFGCCSQGWNLSIKGSNFRKCSSVIIQTDEIHEFLPTPDVTDCGIRRGSSALESPRERMVRLLPPDGMTISCGGSPDLVPLRNLSPGNYAYDRICYNIASASFAPSLVALLQPAPPDNSDVTTGGAVYWVSEAEMRVLFGPQYLLGCASSANAAISVSNDPGRGRSGNLYSNTLIMTFSNTSPCPPDPTPVPGPSINTVNPNSGMPCRPVAPNNVVVINGAFLSPSPRVDIGINQAAVTSSSSTQIRATVPDAGGSCPSFTGPGPLFTCSVDLIVTVGTQTASQQFTYTSTSTTQCLP